MKVAVQNPTRATPARATAFTLALAVLFFPALASAESTAPAAKPVASEKNKDDQTVLLNPFEVKTEKDTGYGALNSNSLALFNVELDKAPVVADIMTQQFIQDTQVRSVEELFN